MSADFKLADWQKEKPIFWFERMVRPKGSTEWVSQRDMFTFDQVAASVGPGWSALLETLSVKLFRLGWDGGLSQVKEKFGTLRFYWRNNIEDEVLARVAEDVVAQEEWRSGQVCDTCGRWGKLRGKGWLYTACDEHTKEGDPAHEDQ